MSSPPPQSAQRPPADIFESHGDACLSRQDYNAAVVMFNQAITYAPHKPSLLCKRSYCYMLSTPPNFDAALQDAEAAIQQDPTFWRGWMQQGEVRLRNGDVQGAETAFGVAVDFAEGNDKAVAKQAHTNAQSLLQSAPALQQPTPPAGQRQSYMTYPPGQSEATSAPQQQPPPQQQQQQQQQQEQQPQQPQPQSPIPTASLANRAPPIIQTQQPTPPISEQPPVIFTQQPTPPVAGLPAIYTHQSTPPRSTPSPASSSNQNHTQESARETQRLNQLGSTPPPVAANSQLQSSQTPTGTVSSQQSPQQNFESFPSQQAGDIALPSQQPHQPISEHINTLSPKSSRESPDNAAILPPQSVLQQPKPPSTAGRQTAFQSSPQATQAKSSALLQQSSPTSPVTVPLNIAQRRKPPASQATSSPSSVQSPGSQSNYSQQTKSPQSVQSPQNGSLSAPTPRIQTTAPPLATQMQTGTRSNSNASQQQQQQQDRQPPVNRSHDASSVSQTAVSSLPLGLDDALDTTVNPSEPPPGYTPNFSSTDPAIRARSQEALAAQLNTLQSTLAIKNKGSLSIRPYTAAGGIDAVRLFYVGLTQMQLTPREIRAPIYLHPSFRKCICLIMANFVN
jgi:hypothetical protein